MDVTIKAYYYIFTSIVFVSVLGCSIITRRLRLLHMIDICYVVKKNLINKHYTWGRFSSEARIVVLQAYSCFINPCPLVGLAQAHATVKSKLNIDSTEE